MVKMVLYITAKLENVTNLQPLGGVDDPNFTYFFKLKCENCGEVTEKKTWVSLNETVLGAKNGTTNLMQKCKFCNSEGTISMDPGRGHPLTLKLSQRGEPAPLMAFDCRGFEPLDFAFSGGWKANSLMGTKFVCIDLDGGEFKEYDDKGHCGVRISNLRAEFKVVELSNSINGLKVYKLRESDKPILEAIFKKHGDIAAGCKFTSVSLRASFLEVVCEVVRRIQADDIDKREEIEFLISQAEEAKLNVSWLWKLLAAQMDLRERRAVLLTAQVRFKEAYRCVRVHHLHEPKLSNNIEVAANGSEKVPTKDPKDKNDNKYKDLSENLDFKQQTELYVARVQDVDQARPVTPWVEVYVKEIKGQIESVLKGERIVKPSEVLRSPYRNRIVEIEKPLESVEMYLAGTIFMGRQYEYDILFKRAPGLDVVRVVLESLIGGSHVHVGVINVWAALLNHEESFNSVASRGRLFCHAGMITSRMLDNTMRAAGKYDVFRTNMDMILKDNHMSEFKADLVFFPIISARHFYLLTFDLRKDEYFLIDNIAYTDDSFKRYDNVPELLRQLFKQYLSDASHPAARRVKFSNINRLRMPWRTKQNGTDCGVFLMRHMETFKGGGSFSSGLKMEGNEQDRQLLDLRQKYLSKILLSDINEARWMANLEVEAYMKLPKEKIVMIGDNAEARVEERLQKFV